MSLLMSRLALTVATCIAVLLFASASWAFPPYRSTDADTAEPWDLELRIGLIRAQRTAQTTAYSSPLGRINLGIPWRLELIGEFEKRADASKLADAAFGFKWVPVWAGPLSVGLEYLTLPPVSDAGGGGIESQLVTTARPGPFRIHANGGAFFDRRPSPQEHGWLGSVLVECSVGIARPGLELAGKKNGSSPATVLAGAGVIIDVGPFDVRLGTHFGIGPESPSWITNIWVARAFHLSGASSK